MAEAVKKKHFFALTISLVSSCQHVKQSGIDHRTKYGYLEPSA